MAWKTTSLLVGLGLAWLGIGLESGRIISVAIVVVLLGFVLRFMPHRNTN